jgi:DNA-nicking Smr family endonuclease
MNRRRQLTDEEHTLWRGFARSVVPLRESAAKLKSGEKRNSAAAMSDDAGTLRGASKRLRLPLSEKPPPLARLDRRQRQRVARGRDTIDARLDLHGMTQGEAHHALLSFLRRAQADGARLVLVVTGKGTEKSRDSERERGVLRRQVPLWLASPEFRPLIVGFDEAHFAHGGQGALYIRLRRIR